MSRRAFHGGMIILILVTALALAGARPAAAQDQGFGAFWWGWLTSAWGQAGAEIDPNGILVPPPILGPVTTILTTVINGQRVSPAHAREGQRPAVSAASRQSER
jgi:hypothetical protein